MATVTGGSGSDVLNGSGSDDILSGGDGNDTLRGGGGNDVLDGGTGNDILDGGSGDDTMIGGSGNDIYIVDYAGDIVIETDQAGVDLVESYVDYALGAYLENLYLIGIGAINGTGNALANSIKGNDDANLLSGLGGNDQIDAAGGNDILLGGAGNDWLKGGSGADKFAFAAADIADGSATDQIADLSFIEGDTIVLSGFREGTARIIGSYAALVQATDVDPNITVAKKNESGQINLVVQGAGGKSQTITITDSTSSAWSAFTAAAVRPTGLRDDAATDERHAVTVDALGNDTGPDLSIVSVRSLSGQGDAKIVDNKVVFTPGHAFNYLTAGETATTTLEYTIITAAGRTTTANIVVMVAGLNDAAEIGGVRTGSVEEGKLASITGELSIFDPDHDQSYFLADTVAGTYGSLSITAEGRWVYTVDETAEALTTLNSGESAVERINIRSEDGTTSSIEITVHGADEVIARPLIYTGGSDPNDKDDFTGGGVLYTTVTSAALAGSNILYGTANADNIDARNGNDVVYGWAGNDVISGGQGIDAIYGGSGDDAIDGNQAQDTLFGGSGADVIRGLQGDDRIIGGYGADTLTGNDGADTFAFLDVRDTGDVITDFLPGVDKIDLSAFTVTGSAYTFTDPIAAKHFSAGHDLIWFADGNTTVVLGDTDGNYATAEFMLTINGNVALTSGDFLL